jgi:hypothetical protein
MGGFQPLGGEGAWKAPFLGVKGRLMVAWACGGGGPRMGGFQPLGGEGAWKAPFLGVKGRAGWFGRAEVVGQGWAVFNRLGVRGRLESAGPWGEGTGGVVWACGGGGPRMGGFQPLGGEGAWKAPFLGVKGRAGWFGLAEVVGQGWAVFNRLGVWALGKRRSLG